MTRKTFLVAIAAVLLASGLMVQPAQAVAITGDIGFAGSGSGMSSGGTSTLTFMPMMTTIVTGDYTGILFGTSSTFAPISWTGMGLSAVLTSSNSPEWSISFGGTTYTFSLTMLQSATMSPGGVSVQGQGLLTINGALNRDPTLGSFAVEGTGSNLSFTIVMASNSATRVPDGGSAVALLGIALAAVEITRRRIFAPKA